MNDKAYFTHTPTGHTPLYCTLGYLYPQEKVARRPTFGFWMNGLFDPIRVVSHSFDSAHVMGLVTEAESGAGWAILPCAEPARCGAPAGVDGPAERICLCKFYRKR